MFIQPSRHESNLGCLSLLEKISAASKNCQAVKHSIYVQREQWGNTFHISTLCQLVLGKLHCSSSIYPARHCTASLCALAAFLCNAINCTAQGVRLPAAINVFFTWVAHLGGVCMHFLGLPCKTGDEKGRVLAI